MRSSFDSYTLGKTIDGYYFGQVYVGPSESSPHITISSPTVFEGQTVSVSAKIDYANGSSVKYGMYSATVYPKDLQNAYNALTQTIQVPLWYRQRCRTLVRERHTPLGVQLWRDGVDRPGSALP